MSVAAKRGENKSGGAKSRGKRGAAARAARRTQASEAARRCLCVVANDAAAEAIARRPRMDSAEAFREHGVDEHKVAETYAHVIKTLSRSIKKGAVQKLLLDVLKEITRVLESKRANDRGGDRGGAQVVVQLVHQVARPERGMESLAAAHEDRACQAGDLGSPALESFEPDMCAIDVRSGDAQAQNAMDT